MKSRYECSHDKAYMFHENAPYYCPECDSFLKFEELTENQNNLFNKLKLK